MRGIVRGAVVVCVLVVAAAAFAGPREPKGGIVSRIVKKLKALGDLLTIPDSAPKP